MLITRNLLILLIISLFFPIIIELVMRPYYNDTLCHSSTNIHDCSESNYYVASTIFCLVTETISTSVGLGVLFYRWYNGLSIKLLRRIDGYWIPVPMDSLLVVILLAGVLRIIKYILLLSDQPHSWAFRESIHTLTIAMTLFPQLLFTMGIITSLPPMLTRQSTQSVLRLFQRATKGYPVNEMLESAQPRSHDDQGLLPSANKLYVPSMSAVFWFGVGFSIYLYIGNTIFALGVGITEDTNEPGNFAIISTLLAISMCLTMFILLIVNSYYCYGVYHVLRQHLTKSYLQEQRNDEMDVVSRLRNIFLTLFTVLTLTLGYTLTSAYRRTGGSTPLPWRIFVLVFYFGILYPGAQLYINHIIAHHSVAQAHRIRGNVITSGGRLNRTEMTSDNPPTSPRIN
ncbi:hypothetical protein BDF22DRAFT_689354 [Syncephalis plumigaleata]|nr:hypothetical protein BDF22DRAFT_689354 [Syncephalis plumigaleata]